MNALKHLLLIILIPIIPFFVHAQDEKAKESSSQGTATMVNFSAIPAEGELYFKATIKGLEKDMQLILEKEMEGEEEPLVVDTQKGVGTETPLSLLYSFKDENPDKRSTLYRLRGLSFSQDGEAEVVTLAEKRFPKGLLGLKEGE